MKTLECELPSGRLVQHVDGGFYRFEKMVRSADDLSVVAIYNHVWPFEPGSWSRSAEEFLSRFTPVPEIELSIARRVPIQVAQENISTAKAARREKKEMR